MGTSNERLKEFFEGYKKLVRKHQIIISGCGCCFSPFFIDLEDNDEIHNMKNNFEWLEDNVENWESYDEDTE